MSSLKMTFSLASLVLLMAFAFIAMPVMAHPHLDDASDDVDTLRDAWSSSVMKEMRSPMPLIYQRTGTL